MDDKAAYDTLSAAIEKKRFFDLEYYVSELKQQPNQKVLKERSTVKILQYQIWKYPLKNHTSVCLVIQTVR